MLAALSCPQGQYVLIRMPFTTWDRCAGLCLPSLLFPHGPPLILGPAQPSTAGAGCGRATDVRAPCPKAQMRRAAEAGCDLHLVWPPWSRLSEASEFWGAQATSRWLRLRPEERRPWALRSVRVCQRGHSASTGLAWSGPEDVASQQHVPFCPPEPQAGRPTALVSFSWASSPVSPSRRSHTSSLPGTRQGGFAASFS